jgi:hypothetical protein
MTIADQEKTAAQRAQALLTWYDRSLRQFLVEHAGEYIGQLDDDRQRLQRIVERNKETVVCFVGVSGIGKSTLLNALVAGSETLAPSGGVGPLTALATEVRYSDTPRLRVEYHTRGPLWKVAFALLAQIARQGKASIDIGVVAKELGLDEGASSDIEKEVREASDPENEGGRKRAEESIRTARLVVAGNQEEDRPLEYLVDALSVACSLKSRFGSSFRTDDAARIDRAKNALQLGDRSEPLIKEQGADPQSFREALREHAAGFLSPLIRRIEVGWPSPILRGGLVLVDLPGVGVAGDVYKVETQRFVREMARAVVLVVNRSGLTDSVMDLLKGTGYWDRLVLASDDPTADPCSLVVAVTHVDDVASQKWRDLDSDENGRRPRTKRELFEEVQDELRQGLLQQFEHQMDGLIRTDGNGVILDARRAAAKSLLGSLQIHPLSAVQYRQIQLQDEEDRPFLKDAEEAGVPALSRALVALAEERYAQRVDTLQGLTRRLAESLWNHLGLVESAWKSDRAAEEAARIRASLQVVLDVKDREYEQRRASFRNFLNETVPEKIKSAVLEAKDQAQKDVAAYLHSLRGAHWATLRAAVTRGGTYSGAKYINLPNDIALKFQDPISAVWSQRLLKVIRQETYQLANAIRQLVEEICDWASQSAAAFVDDKVVQGQKKLVSGQAERLRDVGKEAVEDLREVVKVKIVDVIQKPIRKACEDFVNEGNHIGAGVKARILELFQKLATDATDSASAPARKLLLARYASVETEIRRAFDEWGQPLVSAADAIVERHGDRVRRSDSQKRQRVLNSIEEIRGQVAWLPEWVNAEGSRNE